MSRVFLCRQVYAHYDPPCFAYMYCVVLWSQKKCKYGEIKLCGKKKKKKKIRTADDMFILNGVIQKQLILRKPLYICFVDFSKAFDLANRNILFYKLMRYGWTGRVIDTLRNLYSKTKFRVKCNGMLSPPILNEIGVNQGGVCSGLLFRKYVSDLEQYLIFEQGICIDESIAGHLLLGRWLDIVFGFCSWVTEAIEWCYEILLKQPNDCEWI